MKMEMEDSVSFDLLFRNDYSVENPDKYFPLVRKCIEVSKNDSEILQAVKVGFDLSFKLFSVSELEEELFKYVCPAAKNIFIGKLKLLENSKSNLSQNDTNGIHSQFLNTCLDILCEFVKIFEHFRDIQKITVLEVGSLLLNCAEIIQSCFFHCKESEKLYEDNFTSLAGILSNLFKKCCDLLEELLNILTEKLDSKLDEEKEVSVLCKLLGYLSKSGIVLINLEVKTMAKLWKAFVFLVEKYIVFLKEEFDIKETISCLCTNVISNVETVLDCNLDSPEVNKFIKLGCFLLKLVIKFCEQFLGYLKGCQDSLLNLILTLNKCESGLLDPTKHEKTLNENVMNQLVIGIDPLLTLLIEDENLIENFKIFCKNLPNSKENGAPFLMLCCFVLKKLMLANADIRSLWFKDDSNILEWLFIAVSLNQDSFCKSGEFSSVLVPGKSKRKSDLYEYVLVTTSAFAMTTTSREFNIVERVLLKNVLQTNPWCAILAMDIWCLLVRFADASLGFSQIFNLSKILLELSSDTVRVEKCYLSSLIRRLFLLLTQSQKDVFLKSFDSSFYSLLWGDHEISSIVSDLNSKTVSGVTESLIKPLESIFDKEDFLEACEFNVENSIIGCHLSYESLEKKVGKLWKFNPKVMSSCHQSVKFFKIACALTSYLVPHMSSETLLLVLSQMKKLLSIGQPSCIKLYFACILKSVSSLVIPADSFQKSIIASISDLFRELLTSKEVIVRQKTLEVFFTFSHRTRHVEIITSTVQDYPSLKIEVTNYFQKKIPGKQSKGEDGFIRKLCEVKYEHKCRVRDQSQIIFGCDEVERSSKKPRLDVGGLDDAVESWKQESKKIMENVELLSQFQKKEVKLLCESIKRVLS